MFKLAVDKIDNWIFVTGVPRSGTTFAGKILSLLLEVDYIHEPFNPRCGMPGISQGYRYVRPGLDTEETKRFHELAETIFTYDLKLAGRVREKDPWLKRAPKRIVGRR